MAQQEDIDIDLNAAQLVAENYLELMRAKDYTALFNMHYIPPDDEPSKITQEPASLTLIYAVQYAKDTVDTKIEVFRQGTELKVRKFGLNYPLSLKAMQKMMNLHGKVKKRLIDKEK